MPRPTGGRACTDGPDGDVFAEVFYPWVIPQLEAGHDYVTFMPPNPRGPVSPECVKFFFYLPGAAPEVVDGVCANQHLGTTPAGEFATVVPFYSVQTRQSVKTVGNIPVLLVFADHDRNFIGPAEADDSHPDHQSSEIDYWQKSCGCDLSTYSQRDAGHVLLLHRSLDDTTDAIASWLRRKGQ